MKSISHTTPYETYGPQEVVKTLSDKGHYEENTTPYEIYGPQEVVKTLSDPGHYEEKCWITMYAKKFLLPTDYGVNDKNTLKMDVSSPSPMKPALSNLNVQENSII